MLIMLIGAVLVAASSALLYQFYVKKSGETSYTFVIGSHSSLLQKVLGLLFVAGLILFAVGLLGIVVQIMMFVAAIVITIVLSALFVALVAGALKMLWTK